MLGRQSKEEVEIQGQDLLLSPRQSPSLLRAAVLLLTGVLRHLQGSAGSPPPTPGCANPKTQQDLLLAQVLTGWWGVRWVRAGEAVPCREGLLTIQSWTLEWGAVQSVVYRSFMEQSSYFLYSGTL